jgi:hypothetical protein
VRIQHREMFGTAITDDSVGDTVQSWTINPGWETMFPWLSGIAARYERYVFHSLSFEYLPRVPTSTAGTIILAVDLDPDDGDPPATEAGRAQMLSFLGARETSIWNALNMPFPSGPLKERGHLYVRTQTAESIEPRTSDTGLLQLGMFGVSTTAGTLYGDLFVSYDVELFTPQLNSAALSTGERVGEGILSALTTGTGAARLATVLGVPSEFVDLFDPGVGQSLQSTSSAIATGLMTGALSLYADGARSFLNMVFDPLALDGMSNSSGAYYRGGDIAVHIALQITGVTTTWPDLTLTAYRVVRNNLSGGVTAIVAEPSLWCAATPFPGLASVCQVSFGFRGALPPDTSNLTYGWVVAAGYAGKTASQISVVNFRYAVAADSTYANPNAQVSAKRNPAARFKRFPCRFAAARQYAVCRDESWEAKYATDAPAPPACTPSLQPAPQAVPVRGTPYGR